MNRKIVFTNGCFDLIHKGHIELLNFCERIADELIIAINSDISISKIKGSDRPYQDENTRKELLQAIYPNSKIIIFNESNPLEVIKNLKPNIIVKGGDYKKNEVIGASYVDEVIIFPYQKELSTTIISEKIIGKLKI